VLQAPSKDTGELIPEHLANLIGQPESKVSPLFPEKVIHTGRNSFHGSLKPIRKEKRYFKVRFGMKDDRVATAEIKLQASVNPNLKGRVIELIKPAWGSPKTAPGDAQLYWIREGVKLVMFAPPPFDPNGPPPKSKPFLRLLFSQVSANVEAVPAP